MVKHDTPMHLAVDALDLAGLFAISAALLGAFYFQLVLHELPCALCNLIRVAMLLSGAGFYLNIRFAPSGWNYLLSGVGALIGSLISLLFLFVKAPPGTPPTGSAILGLHMYSWTFIFFNVAIIYCMVGLAVTAARPSCVHGAMTRLRRLALVLFVLVAVGNLLSAFMQNGFGPFQASNQQHYKMLYDGDVMKP